MAEAKNKGGRPPALVPDEKTLTTVKGLGQIQASTKECAAVLGVSEPTYFAFKKRHSPLIDDTYNKGRGEGLASLRRQQFAMAKTSATMAIWLGKQYLGQKDKQEISSNVNLTVSDARSKLESLIDRQIATEPNQKGSGTTH